MSELLIATPLRLEALLVRSGARTRVCTTGMGPRRARAAVSGLLREPGRALLVMGFCGGLVQDSQPGELVVASEVRGPDGTAVLCASAVELTDRLHSCGLRARSGPLVSVSSPARGAARAQLRQSGAVAVDMESAWLAAGAGERAFAVVRAVLDTPDRELTRPWLTARGTLSAAVSLHRAACALHEWGLAL